MAVSPAADTIPALGGTVQLSAAAFDENGHGVAGAGFSWESGDTSVATVDGSGLVTARGNGTATITAMSGAASGSATATVVQRVDSVAVSPAADTIPALGGTVQLSAAAFDENGHGVAGAGFSWESGDTSVATVDGSGLVTARGNGTATITAMSGAASGSATATVVQRVDSVAVSPAADTIPALGGTVQLSAAAFDENGHGVAGAGFSWESGDTSVATVDGSGLVTARGNGTATITVSAGAALGTAEVAVGARA